MAKKSSIEKNERRRRMAKLFAGRRKKLNDVKRREIVESVITGRKTAADLARLYNISQPTVSRIVAQHRMTRKIAA